MKRNGKKSYGMQNYLCRECGCLQNLYCNLSVKTSSFLSFA
ncbi:MAG: hypothetical protein LBL33_06185 [Tannerella sp.]|nr:hypothetical protein [Tannerella sp.]